MPLDTVGILTPIEFAAEQPTVLSTALREVFVEETPLFARLPHVQGTAESYTINSYDVRSRAYVLGAGDITNAATTLPIADGTPFQVGDILELNDGTNVEHVEVTVAPSATATSLTVRRGRGGTTGTAFATATPTNIYLIGNSRTGGEIDQQAARVKVTGLVQNIQTFQYPVQVGGKAEAIRNVSLPRGANSVFGRDRAIKALEMARDVEYSMYYGRGETPAASGDRAKMKGLRNLVATANLTTAAGGSYTRASFIAATIQKIFDAGGNPDTILVSTSFMGYLDTWVPSKTTFMNEQTRTLGFPIDSFVVPINGKPMRILPSLQLRAGTAAVITSSDLDVRYLREMYWKPREARGDAMEGDWLGDYAINLEHRSWHAWVEGITSAA